MEPNERMGNTMENKNGKRGVDVLLVNRHFSDLNPIVVGEERCEPGHRFGPFVRKYTLLHCVLSGKGTYTCGGVTYPVRAGQIFRILPGETTVYQADEQDPWHYCWIGFDGALSGKMAQMPPVFPVSSVIMRIFQPENEQAGLSEYRVASKLFRLYDELFCADQPDRGDYVRRVRDYIDAMYMKKISIEELAGQLHLNRRYLTRLFRAETGQNIQEYLMTVRMQAASDCLRAGMKVGETAERCGYEDMFLFSRLFKRRFGISPSEYAKRTTSR